MASKRFSTHTTSNASPVGKALASIWKRSLLPLSTPSKRISSTFLKSGPFLGSRFNKLSMGQQNRVNLIRYLLQDFDLLILDESLANVDEKLRQTIIVHIKEIFPEKMFLYISHNLMEVSSFCDEIMVFGANNEKKHYRVIEGQNCQLNREVDKRKRDVTMLEVMNSF
ncbi:related to ABC transporter, ATP-binding protein [Desulfotalea psychrophila LSv54]|uniref:Related to ABC transporter, ATP-binding protein n=2 Tax=Desulfotalea psychrophila TaxID=84980 RepID=Q6AQP1_DESPS|nr:related to ABC transporter, ATP-binding protein [Desulfotalea psychrophila LSv54]